MELEDNRRRLRISESEEAALLAVASPRIFQDPTEPSFARSEDPAKESATSH